jgi:hypothetical protein
MASIDQPPVSPENQKAWNEAYERLIHFLDAFALGDRIQVSRLALHLLDQAQQLHHKDSSLNPTTLTMEQAQKLVSNWLATNLVEADRSSSEILARGYIALLLSRMFLTSPTSFLASPLPEDLRQSLRQTLLVTGPDLNISSMTSRHFDYGPMLGLARQTWHRFDLKSALLAILFWAGVYGVLYACLSNFL